MCRWRCPISATLREGLTTSTNLKTGESLVIKTVEPPLNDYADKVGCWPIVRDELLGGELNPWLFTPYFFGEIEGEVVGSMGLYTPRDRGDVGVVEYVKTEEEHRGKGIASALLGHLIERFIGGGGLALYLCTTNPIAGGLYEKHGFWYKVGDGMRYLAPNADDFDRTYLAFCGSGQIRDATWADLTGAVVLYNHPEPKWFIKEYLTGCYLHSRYERHFVTLMKRIENGKGAMVVLQNPKGRVVGVAVLERVDTFSEQHVATLSFRVCPPYFQQVPELLDAAKQRAEELSIRVLQIYIASPDEQQIELVKAAGFSQEARLRDRLGGEDGEMDLLIYSSTLPGSWRPMRDQGDYYGGRPSWQKERIHP